MLHARTTCCYAVEANDIHVHNSSTHVAGFAGLVCSQHPGNHIGITRHETEIKDVGGHD